MEKVLTCKNCLFGEVGGRFPDTYAECDKTKKLITESYCKDKRDASCPLAEDMIKLLTKLIDD